MKGCENQNIKRKEERMNEMREPKSYSGTFKSKNNKTSNQLGRYWARANIIIVSVSISIMNIRISNNDY